VKTRDELMTKAREMWREMSDNERTGVRFGMFPAEAMRKAEREGFERGLASALMQVASNDGGMRG